MTKRDLSGQLTVFHLTVGATAYPFSAEALANQTCTFRLETVRNMAPMAAAFQFVLDTCKTEFFVQVDEDMVLLPQAVEWMYDAMQQAPKTCAMICFYLWDHVYGRPIQGVKIYRHSLACQVRYVDMVGLEGAHNEALRKLGYQIVILDSVSGVSPPVYTVGEHGRIQSPLEAFESARKRGRRLGNGEDCLLWTIDDLPGILKRLGIPEEKFDSPELWTAAGLLCGIGSAIPQTSGSRDYRTYQTRDFTLLRSVLKKA